MDLFKEKNQINYFYAKNKNEVFKYIKTLFYIKTNSENNFIYYSFDTINGTLYENNSSLIVQSNLDQKQNNQFLFTIKNKNKSGICNLTADMQLVEKDIPVDFFREIKKLIVHRKLFPVVKTFAQDIISDVSNKNGKIIFKLHQIKNLTIENWEGKKKNLTNVFGIEPLRGYANISQGMIKDIITKFTIEKIKNPIQYINNQSEINSPIEERNKFNLDYKMSPAKGIQILYRHFTQNLFLQEKYILKNIDGESIHDYRIFLRKARTLVNEFREFLPPDQYLYLNNEFAWMSEVTTPVRDMDVHLQLTDIYLGIIPERLVQTFIDFQKWITSSRENSYAYLVKMFNSERYKKFKNILKKNINCRRGSKKKSLGDYVHHKINNQYMDVIKLLSRIDRDTSPHPEIIHDLRKEIKKLRYLMEFFVSIYSIKKIQPIIDALKIIQSHLGVYNDTKYQKENLNNYLNKYIQMKMKYLIKDNAKPNEMDKEKMDEIVLIEDVLLILIDYTHKKNEKYYLEIPDVLMNFIKQMDQANFFGIFKAEKKMYENNRMLSY